MRVHVISAALFGAAFWMIWTLVHSMEKDFEVARPMIEQEAHKRVQEALKQEEPTPAPAPTPEVKKEAPKLPSLLNRRITQVASAESQNDGPVEAPMEVIPTFFETRTEGDLWCREIKGEIYNDPKICYYPRACFRCPEGAMIPPEVDSAVPFCRTGNQASVVDLRCCKQGDSCPSVRDCSRATDKDLLSCLN